MNTHFTYWQYRNILWHGDLVVIVWHTQCSLTRGVAMCSTKGEFNCGQQEWVTGHHIYKTQLSCNEEFARTHI